MAQIRDKPIPPTTIFNPAYFAVKFIAYSIFSKRLQSGYKLFPLVDNNLFTTYY
jgi:hypothetical protein